MILRPACSRRNFLASRSCLAVAVILSACNSPYPECDERANVYYTTFTSEPGTLDPGRAYGSFMYEILCQIVEPPFQYHLLKRPYTLEPLTAVAVPRPETRQVVLQGKTIEATVYTVRIRPGIKYQNHPCFAEGTRELVADDYVHAIRRLADPRVQNPILPTLQQNLLGLREYCEAIEAALAAERKRRAAAVGPLYNQEQDERLDPIRLDYAAFAFPGVRQVDRYAFEVVLPHPYPQMLYWMAMPFFAPVPSEAIEYYNQRALLERGITFDRNPVGTGPYVLAELDPTNQIVLERNPNFREERYPDLPEPQDPPAKALFEEMRDAGMLRDAGARVPLIDRVVFRMEKEWVPRWNKFRQGYYDSCGISSDVFDQAVTLTSQGDAVLSDDMREQGIRLLTSPAAVIHYFAFNMDDPVIGGYSEAKQKLRQAISIAYDVEEEIAIFLNGRATVAHSLTPPGIFGYEEGEAGINPFVYRWDAERNRPVRRSLDEARQLLAEAGYPGGYGPDGKPLEIRFVNGWAGGASRPRLDFVTKQFRKLGIHLVAETTDWNRFQEKVRAGNYQMIAWGWAADYPDPENFLFLLYGPNGRGQGGSENNANYASPEFDRQFEQMRHMENTPERLAIIRKMNHVLQRDAPWIFGYHDVAFALVHEWYRNAHPHAMANNLLKYRRIDPELRAERREEWNRPRWIPVLIVVAVLVLAVVPAAWAAVRHLKEA
ncbi:MAG TPA: ABC transporter substrate-binding protein [Planctomycetota bacterium]|nr:ABC transporter substrate-binding protein [Planctomycetota bacterium]